MGKKIFYFLAIFILSFFAQKICFAQEDPNSNYDLSAGSITVTPAAPAVGKPCSIIIKIVNNGKANLFTSAGLNYEYNFGNFTLQESLTPNPTISKFYRPGEILTYTYKGIYKSPGDMLLKFTIDAKDEMDETNEKNNYVDKKITVYSPSYNNLSIDSITITPAKIIQAQNVTIDIGIKNTGKTGLVDDMGLTPDEVLFSLPHFQYDPGKVSHDNLPTVDIPLEPDRVIHYIYSGYFSEAGNYAFSYSINRNGRLIESNTADNATSTSLKVYASQSEADDFTTNNKTVHFSSSTIAIIDWNTTEATNGLLLFGERESYATKWQVAAGVNTTDHTATLENLRMGTCYNFIIKNTKGLVEKNETLDSFCLPANKTLEITALPTATASGANKTATTSWATNYDSNSYVFYKLKSTNSYIKAGSALSVSQHREAMKDLTLGEYEYFIVSQDASGNTATSSNYRFTIGAETTPASSANSSTQIVSDQNSPSNKSAKTPASQTNKGLEAYQKYKGMIVVNEKNEYWYINASIRGKSKISDSSSLQKIMSKQNTKMSNANLFRIIVGLSGLSGIDSDNDGLPDMLEEAIGTDKLKADTDNDGFTDGAELEKGYSPFKKNARLPIDNKYAQKFSGKFLTQIQKQGLGWYVNPQDMKRYYLGNTKDAIKNIKSIATPINQKDFESI